MKTLILIPDTIYDQYPGTTWNEIFAGSKVLKIVGVNEITRISDYTPEVLSPEQVKAVEDLYFGINEELKTLEAESKDEKVTPEQRVNQTVSGTQTIREALESLKGFIPFPKLEPQKDEAQKKHKEKQTSQGTQDAVKP
jgi:hypothetical protein